MPKVFLSWSGKASHDIAIALNRWLPVMLQSVKPFISSADLEKGGRWTADLAIELQETKFGIIVLTPTNLTAPWILFEAGAISKVVSDSKVAPFLANVKPSELPEPLRSFNATHFDKEEVRKLVKAVNASSSEDAVNDDLLGRSFDAVWPSLENEIQHALSAEKAQTDGPPKASASGDSVDTILQELLVLARSQSQILVNSGRFPAVDDIRILLMETADDIVRGALNPAVIKDLQLAMAALEEAIQLSKADTDMELVVAAMHQLKRPVRYILSHTDDGFRTNRGRAIRRVASDTLRSPPAIVDPTS